MSAARMYRRKPTVIEAVEFEPDPPTLKPGTEGVVPVEGADVVVRAVAAPIESLAADAVRFEAWNELHESWVGLRPGDFLRVDKPGDVYPIDRATFEATYELVQEGP
ncbi:MAG TPA: hypothetical protein VK966_04960 [Longimicrobiales bacterium]|nr:hypothetical protein [Longimicrobiales bacterium]